MQENKILRLDKPVVVRKMPMTDVGSDMLRAVRRYQTEQYKTITGEDVEIPYPVCLHFMLKEFCDLKGIEY